ncbi:MAG: phosphoglycerate kinase [Rhizobiaceae bacterium]|nr:phosphoglycerate kinase [Rhizobiaceae bacterium]
MPSFKTLDDVDVKSKRALVRVDLNVPMADGAVTDATRILRILPTINEISDKGGKVILLAHFGRPKGEMNPEMSLAPVVSTLSDMLGKPVAFGTDCIGPMAEAAVSAMNDGDVVLLENTRFHAGEEKNDPEFVAALAANGDLFVSDAFSAAHRAHASTEGLARHMEAVAGRTMQAELEALEAGLGNPQKPVIAIVGGAKVSTKLDLLSNLVSKVDMLVIGGGMANTFLAAQGTDVGKSLCEHDLADTARNIFAEAEKENCEIILPTDVVVASEFAANAPNKIVAAGECPADQMILDAGPKSAEAIGEKIRTAKTLIWNGPLGAFEIEPFDAATVAVAKIAAEQTAKGELVSVGGGGDTVAALNHADAAKDFSYVSTAGGAFLEWMEGKDLPGVAVLSK